MPAARREPTVVWHVVTTLIMQRIRRRDDVFPHLRNIVLNRLCFGYTVNCSFAAHGCNFTGTGVKVYQHEFTCNFSPENDGNISSIEPNNMNRSLGRPMEELILQELECPVCYTCLEPKIMQCFNGHQLCDKCTMIVHLCPICRGPKAVARNSILEFFYFIVEVPCSNKSYGCVIRGRGMIIVKHQTSCSFLPISCPLTDEKCKWMGSTFQIVNHCKTKHPENFSLETELQWGLNEFFELMSSNNIFYIRGVIFRCIWSVRDNNVMFSVTYIKETPMINRFKYEIKIYSSIDQELVSAKGVSGCVNNRNFQCICNNSTLISVNQLRIYRILNLDVRFVLKIVVTNGKNLQIQ